MYRTPSRNAESLTESRIASLLPRDIGGRGALPQGQCHPQVRRLSCTIGGAAWLKALAKARGSSATYFSHHGPGYLLTIVAAETNYPTYVIHQSHMANYILPPNHHPCLSIGVV
jgi:hypothetical protein